MNHVLLKNFICINFILPRQLSNLPVDFAGIDGGTVLAAIPFVVQSKGPVVLVAKQCVSYNNTLQLCEYEEFQS